MKNAEKPILSISLLTSNRMDTIPRCLDSLIPIREALPCELIIVDTSNNPEVRECIMRHTDIVEEFEWCNDFSKARNVGLNKAKGEWFMFLDDDEWFLDSEPLIQFFLSGEYKQYGFAHYIVRNFTDSSFKSYSQGWVKRMTKLSENTQFYSKVHEYLAPNIGENKALEAIVGHSGYIFKTLEDKKRHFERNSSLLHKMEAEEPDDLRWKVQLMQEYRFIHDWEGMEQYCKKSIDYLHSQKYNVMITHLVQLYVGYVNALINNGKYREAKAFYLKIKKTKLLEKKLILNAFMDFMMSKIAYELEDYKLMHQHVLGYLSAYEIYHENPRAYVNEEIGNLYGEPFVDDIFYTANRFALYAELELKIYDKIDKYYPNIKWDDTDKIMLSRIQINLLDALYIQKVYKRLAMVLKDSMATYTTRINAVQWLLHKKQEDETSFYKVLDVVKEMNIWKWYDLYGELAKVYTEITNKDVMELGRTFINEVPNVFQIPDVVRKSFQGQGIEIESLYKELDFMTWKRHLTEHFECMNMEQLEVLKENLEKSSLKGDVRFAYFMMLYAEQKLLHIDEADMDFETYNELLYAFSSYTCAVFETLYADEISNMELEQLPHNYQAALWLKVYFEEVEKDIKTALPCLSKVIETYPMFSDVVSGYLKCIKSEMLG